MLLKTTCICLNIGPISVFWAQWLGLFQFVSGTNMSGLLYVSRLEAYFDGLVQDCSIFSALALSHRFIVKMLSQHLPPPKKKKNPQKKTKKTKTKTKKTPKTWCVYTWGVNQCINTGVLLLCTKPSTWCVNITANANWRYPNSKPVEPENLPDEGRQHGATIDRRQNISSM